LKRSNYHSAGSRPAAADYVLACVCLCIHNFCTQDNLKTNLWIYAKFYSLYILHDTLQMIVKVRN